MSKEQRIEKLEQRVKELEAENSILRAQQWAHWTYTYEPRPAWYGYEYKSGNTTGGMTEPVHQGPITPQGTAGRRA